jgi:hypothetical protein
VAQAKKKYPRVTTPIGVAIYPHLLKPDTKFKPEGEYTVKVRFAPAEIADLQSKCEALAKARMAEAIEAKPALKKVAKFVLPFKPELDDEGDETGNLIGNFKMKAEVTKKDGTKFVQKPAVFDAGGIDEDTGEVIKPKPVKVNPWSGSELRVNCELFPYFNEKDKEAGVALRMFGVQVVKLISGGSGDADSFGFGAVAGGFVDEAEEATTETSKDDASPGADAGDSDF